MHPLQCVPEHDIFAANFGFVLYIFVTERKKLSQHTSSMKAALSLTGKRDYFVSTPVTYIYICSVNSILAT